MIKTVEHHPSPLEIGSRVKVASKFPIGHYRVPMYIRGKEGQVVRNLGKYINPEQEAFGKNAGNKLWYYMVSFDQGMVWPDYVGEPADKLEIEIFENWLEKV
ncbi:SH3-like domain-containing protein [Pedobacter jamesrossensis]|uniref:SH3-like domain-containing protein n=1 Tax=Pedobacter jamesrossensis TaxID=1908238 RepID=A0ABV8NII5_9SPHI